MVQILKHKTHHYNFVNIERNICGELAFPNPKSNEKILEYQKLNCLGVGYKNTIDQFLSF